jgi:hypothetical protein
VVSGCWPPWYVRPVADAGGRFLPPELCLRQGVPVLVLYGNLATADPSQETRIAMRMEADRQTWLMQQAMQPTPYSPEYLGDGRLRWRPNPAPLATLGELARRKA